RHAVRSRNCLPANLLNLTKRPGLFCAVPPALSYRAYPDGMRSSIFYLSGGIAYTPLHGTFPDTPARRAHQLDARLHTLLATQVALQWRYVQKADVTALLP